MRVGVTNACEEVNCGKEIRRLDQKNSVEFVQLKMSSEIDDSTKLKCNPGETDKFNNSLLRLVCRLNDVVSKRSPATSLCSGAVVRGTAPNRDLAWNLVEILDDVKAGKTNPPQDDEDDGKLSPHGRDHLRNITGCQDN
jgi:hypothetical protein